MASTFVRACPRCHGEVVHETEYDFKAANRSKRVCPGCLDVFCVENGRPVGSLTRICPRCSKPIYYGNFRGKKYADEDSRLCKPCADDDTRAKCRDEAWREEHAEVLKNAWADENSTFHTDEYRASLSEGQRNRTDDRSIGGRAAWESRGEESRQAFIKNAQTDEANDKRSASHLRRRQENPELWQTEKAKAGWNISGEKGKNYIDKCIATARLNGERTLFERSLEEPLAKLGFVHTKQVGKWWVDYLNEETKVVVEAYGDWYHCHPRFDKKITEIYGGVNPDTKMTPEEKHRTDAARVADIESMGYTVIVIWQYDVRRWLRWIETSLAAASLSPLLTTGSSS